MVQDNQYPVRSEAARCFAAIDFIPTLVEQYRVRGLLPIKRGAATSHTVHLSGGVSLSRRMRVDLCSRFSISTAQFNRSTAIKHLRPDLIPGILAGTWTLWSAYQAALKMETRTGVVPVLASSKKYRKIRPECVVSDFIEVLTGALPVLEDVRDGMSDDDRAKLRPYLKRLRRVVAAPKQGGPR